MLIFKKKELYCSSFLFIILYKTIITTPIIVNNIPGINNGFSNTLIIGSKLNGKLTFNILISKLGKKIVTMSVIPVNIVGILKYLNGL